MSASAKYRVSVVTVDAGTRQAVFNTKTEMLAAVALICHAVEPHETDNAASVSRTLRRGFNAHTRTIEFGSSLRNWTLRVERIDARVRP